MHSKLQIEQWKIAIPPRNALLDSSDNCPKNLKSRMVRLVQVSGCQTRFIEKGLTRVKPLLVCMFDMNILFHYCVF